MAEGEEVFDMWRGPRRVRRGVRRGAGALTAAAALALAFVGPGTQPAAAASGCPGHQVRTVPFATGQLQVYRSGQYVCAVTLARSPGPRRQMSVSLQARGARAVVDSGRFTRLAGPVKVRATHRCVRAVGVVSGKKGASGWMLC
ncbi:hypothetical protein OG204_12180 [Streptomyces sp. NBC_01387]|uniref:hypothetical protein n=2 Tax=Streptomyces TaxID=1883 RepID=UPI002024F0C1|nr:MULTISPECIES: hypothetical protein [unclassified Streptomyces]